VVRGTLFREYVIVGGLLQSDISLDLKVLVFLFHCKSFLSNSSLLTLHTTPYHIDGTDQLERSSKVGSSVFLVTRASTLILIHQLPHSSLDMSAPNQGRQSPDPERQTGAQQQDIPTQPGSGKVSAHSPCLRLPISHAATIPFFLKSVTSISLYEYELTSVLQVDNSKDKDAGKEDQTANLESNPKHVLEDAAKDKTSKTMN
jgi:hypothetical protein